MNEKTDAQLKRANDILKKFPQDCLIHLVTADYIDKDGRTYMNTGNYITDQGWLYLAKDAWTREMLGHSQEN